MSDSLQIKEVEIYPLEVPLIAAFTTSASELEVVSNLAVSIELTDGARGWGEVPILPPITLEDQASARAALADEAGLLPGKNAGEWRRIAAELTERIPHLAAVRAGIEMAWIDALTRSWGAALFRFFGGCEDQVVTDITIPICPAAAAQDLAARYRQAGFTTIKVKIGGDLGLDSERVRAIRRGHAECRLILDANAGYTAEQILALLRELRLAKIEVALLEQPVAREDWEGLGKLAREAGMPV
ncbi:MAG: enolase C-terminal domain-like protein, partial [Gammaproteobacteria bacterium]